MPSQPYKVLKAQSETFEDSVSRKIDADTLNEDPGHDRPKPWPPGIPKMGELYAVVTESSTPVSGKSEVVNVMM